MAEALGQIHLQGIVVIEAIGQLIARISQIRISARRLWRIEWRGSVDVCWERSVHVRCAEQMVTMLTHITDSEDHVCRKALFNPETVLLHGRHFQVGLNTGRRDLGAGNRGVRRQVDWECSRRDRNFVIQRANGSCVATVAHVIQLLIVDAVAGMNGGSCSPSQKSPRHPYPWSEQEFPLIFPLYVMPAPRFGFRPTY